MGSPEADLDRYMRQLDDDDRFDAFVKDVEEDLMTLSAAELLEVYLGFCSPLTGEDDVKVFMAKKICLKHAQWRQEHAINSLYYALSD